jgi:hypothetical protein
VLNLLTVLMCGGAPSIPPPPPPPPPPLPVLQPRLLLSLPLLRVLQKKQPQRLRLGHQGELQGSLGLEPLVQVGLLD